MDSTYHRLHCTKSRNIFFEKPHKFESQFLFSGFPNSYSLFSCLVWIKTIIYTQGLFYIMIETSISPQSVPFHVYSIHVTCHMWEVWQIFTSLLTWRSMGSNSGSSWIVKLYINYSEWKLVWILKNTPLRAGRICIPKFITFPTKPYY